MAQVSGWRAAAVVCVLAGFICVSEGTASAQADAVLPPGVKAVWDMQKAWRESTPTREEFCINGLWRWQPAVQDDEAAPPRGWGYFKVPGPWPGITSYIQKDSQTLYGNPSWGNVNLGGVSTAWYQREIGIPPTWVGRRIALHAEYVNSRATVFIDGARVGEILYPGGDLDITSACRPGAGQVLTLRVTALPLSDVVAIFSDTNAPRQGQGRVERRGLCGDLFLQSMPAGPRVDDVKVNTSVRNWQIAFDTAVSDLQPGARYRLQARITDGDRLVKEVTSDPFTAADVKDGRITFSGAWHPDKLWDTDTPQNMYGVQVALGQDGGQGLDAFYPVRFGFREFWIVGRDFYLNGTRIHTFLGSSHDAIIGAAWDTYDAARESLLRQKTFGVNLVHTHHFGVEPGSHLSHRELLRAADDVGMLVSFSMPHMGHYSWDAPDAATSNGYARTAEFYVRVAENHPSVVMYVMNHNSLGYGGGSDPDLIDGLHNARGEIGPRTDRNAQRGMLTQSIVEGFDPTRVVYHHSSGNMGNMHTNNLYLNFTPIREICDWFEHWATVGVKPVLLSEYDSPYDLDWTMYRGWLNGQRSFGSTPLKWEYCPAEWASQFLGDKGFDLPESDKQNLRWEANNFRTRDTWYRWDYPHAIVGESTQISPLKQQVRWLYITDQVRAFRTWGLSSYNEFSYASFWALRDGVNRGRRNLPVDWDGIQRPGFSPDYIDRPYESFMTAYDRQDWVPGAAAQALYRNSMPLLAYIGGKPERFTTKDHNFLPGQQFQKQLILINDSREPVTCDCSWSLAVPQPLAGQANVTVDPGQQQCVPLNFALPADLAPGAYNLAATVRFSTGETQEDGFQVDVMAPPPTAAPAAGQRIAVFDPAGETTKLLTAMGVSFQPVGATSALDDYDVLVVGKGALTPDGPAPNIARLSEGLKVVMFEQTADALMKRFGFRTAEYCLRNTFARVLDHPLLAGVSTANLHDWAGAGTILPPRLAGFTIRQRSGEKLKEWCGIEMTRGQRCGNWGSVASVLIEKPARGDFLPVVDGGFSLQYSPLMVCRDGSGVMVLCQLDVTGRTEDDPAARRLVANILDYVAAYQAPAHRSVLYAGEDAGRAHLAQSGLSVTAYQGGPLGADQALVVGPGGAQTLAANAGAVRQWLAAGGRLLALGLSGSEASALLPAPVSTGKAEHICTVFDPPGEASLLAGIGPADVMNRDPRQVDLVTGGAQVLGDGVLALAANGNAVLCQIAPWQFDYKKYYDQKRTFRRTAFLVTRVLGNMGCSEPTPLADRLSKPVAAGEAPRWSEGFYLDQPEEFDDPYRSFGW